ncbi:hypothetical protein NL676_038717 [Syzygium grande]|nr:hypothetical protein NL676_038717 [Syzygium grande]
MDGESNCPTPKFPTNCREAITQSKKGTTTGTTVVGMLHLLIEALGKKHEEEETAGFNFGRTSSSIFIFFALQFPVFAFGFRSKYHSRPCFLPHGARTLPALAEEFVDTVCSEWAKR